MIIKGPLKVSVEYLKERLISLGLSPYGKRDVLSKRLIKTLSSDHWQDIAILYLDIYDKNTPSQSISVIDIVNIITEGLIKLQSEYHNINNVIERSVVVPQVECDCHEIINGFYYCNIHSDDNDDCIGISDEVQSIDESAKKPLYDDLLCKSSYEILTLGDDALIQTSPIDNTSDDYDPTNIDILVMRITEVSSSLIMLFNYDTVMHIKELLSYLPNVIACNRYGFHIECSNIGNGNVSQQSEGFSLTKLPRDIVSYIITLIYNPHKIYLLSFANKYMASVCRDMKKYNYDRFVKKTKLYCDIPLGINYHSVMRITNILPSGEIDGEDISLDSSYRPTHITTWNCGRKHGKEIVYSYCETSPSKDYNIIIHNVVVVHKKGTEPFKREELLDYFSKYGIVIDINIRITEKASITYDDPIEAAAAVAQTERIADNILRKGEIDDQLELFVSTLDISKSHSNQKYIYTISNKALLKENSVICKIDSVTEWHNDILLSDIKYLHHTYDRSSIRSNYSNRSYIGYYMPEIKPDDLSSSLFKDESSLIYYKEELISSLEEGLYRREEWEKKFIFARNLPKITETIHRRGILDGIHNYNSTTTSYDENGNAKYVTLNVITSEWKNGKKHGIETITNKRKRSKEILEWKDGVLHGTSYRFKNNQLIFETKWEDGYLMEEKKIHGGNVIDYVKHDNYKYHISMIDNKTKKIKVIDDAIYKLEEEIQKLKSERDNVYTDISSLQEVTARQCQTEDGYVNSANIGWYSSGY